MVQDDKEMCLMQLISKETYIIWLSFMMHFYKMMMSLTFFLFFSFFFFYIFSKFQFFGLLGGLGGGGARVKIGPKWQKIVCRAWYLRNHASYGRHSSYGISKGFLYFFKILIFAVARSVKVQKMAHNGFISQEPYIIWS